MSTMEIYMICAAAVLIAMVLGQAYEQRCNNKEEDENSDELTAIKKRLELLETAKRERESL